MTMMVAVLGDWPLTPGVKTASSAASSTARCGPRPLDKTSTIKPELYVRVGITTSGRNHVPRETERSPARESFDSRGPSLIYSIRAPEESHDAQNTSGFPAGASGRVGTVRRGIVGCRHSAE